MATSAVTPPDPNASTPNPTPAATPATTPTTPAQPSQQPQQQQAPQNGTQPAAKTPQQQQQPTILAPVHTGFRGMLDRVLDAIGGTKSPKIYTDQNGQMFKVEQNLTTGQKVARAIQLGLTGAARGMAAGKGAGNGGKAFDAGVESGLATKQGWASQEQQAQEQIRQNRIDQANATIRQQQIAKNQFEMTRAQIEATQHDQDYAQRQEQHEKDLGSSLLGTYTFDDLHKIQQQDPNFWKNHYANRTVPIPHYDESGKADGVSVYLRAPGVNDEVMPKGTTVHVYVPPKGPDDEPSFEEVTPTDPMTRGQWTTFNQGEYAKYQQYKMQKAQLGAQEALGQQRTSKAEANEAQAGENNARADNLAGGGNGRVNGGRRGAGTGTGAAPTPQSDQAAEDLAQAVYEGRLKVNDMKREAKGENLDPNKVIARAFAIAKDKGENLNLTQIEQEDKFASSTKVQGVMDGIDRMLGTRGNQGYLDQMVGYAQQAGLTSNAPFNVVSQGIRRWGGDAAAKNFETAVSETRRSIAGLIGNPLLGGGETDKKLEQANELLGKNPTLENIKSAVGILKTALTTQKQSMMDNNRYLRARYGTGQPVPQQQQQQQQQGQYSAVSSDGKWAWDGSKWIANPNQGAGANAGGQK